MTEEQRATGEQHMTGEQHVTGGQHVTGEHHATGDGDPYENLCIHRPQAGKDALGEG